MLRSNDSVHVVDFFNQMNLFPHIGVVCWGTIDMCTHTFVTILQTLVDIFLEITQKSSSLDVRYDNINALSSIPIDRRRKGHKDEAVPPTFWPKVTPVFPPDLLGCIYYIYIAC